MRSERRTLRCTSCGKEFPARVILRVDYGRPEDRDADLTDGSLFTFRCPHCGKDTYANHYLLWVDEGRTVAVCNLTCEEEKNAVDEALSALNSFGRETTLRRRFVQSPARLCEKVQIFSEGLDDRVVEIVKLYLAEEVRRTHPEKTLTDVLFYPDGDGYGVLFQCPDGDLFVQIDKETLSAASAQFCFAEPAPEVVDAAWAISYLTGGKG